MKFSIKTKAAILWSLSVISGSAALTGLGILSFTGNPDAFFRFLKTYQLIRQEYFREVDEETLWIGAERGMVAALGDPYSQLLTDDTYDSFMEQTNSEYGGIGVVIGKGMDGYFYILSVFPGSTAEKAGLLPGDRLDSIDGRTTADMDLTQAADTIRGKAGTTVSLSVQREGELRTFPISRSAVSLPTVRSLMVTPDIGYIHIYSFGAHTAEEFKKEYEKLSEAGIKGLILDLRMNPGGLLDSAVAVADQLLSGGPIVSYRQKDGTLQEFSIQGTDRRIPLAVLIDRNSASAAEILAGAVQDKKEGILIGEKSFGKGTVQIVHPMTGEEALKLSVAQYFTAAGRQIDRIGITPDIAVSQEGLVFDPESDTVILRAVQELMKK